MAENYTDTGVEEAPSPELDYHALNAQLNLYDADGRIQFDADRKAARQYFLQHVNQNTVFFHDLEEKLKYLVDEGYYEQHVLDQYDFADIKALYKQAYAHKFRFPTFLGTFKYYTSYAQDVRREALPGALRGSRCHGVSVPGARRHRAGSQLR